MQISTSVLLPSTTSIVRESTPSAATILSLPKEILDMILHHVVMPLLVSLETVPTPVSVFEKFRSLHFVCKMFNICLKNSCPQVEVDCSLTHTEDGLFFVPKIVDVPKNSNKAWEWSSRSWRNHFLFCQNLMVQDAIDRFGRLHHAKLGKFWLNPELALDDLDDIYYSSPDQTVAGLLLVIGPLLQRCIGQSELRRTKDIPGAIKWIQSKRSEEHTIGETVHVVRTLWGSYCKFTYSVCHWTTPKLSSSIIAPEVREWWVWQRGDNDPMKVFSGYHENKAWVWWQDKELYTNFEQTKQIGHFQGNKLLKSGYQDCWVSKWSVDMPIDESS